MNRLPRTGVWAVIAVSGLALSEAGVRAEPPAGGGPLSGPTVAERNVPGTGAGFSGAPMPLSNKDRGNAVPHRAFMQAVEKALGADAPESLRLSAEQRAAIESAANAHQAELRAFMQEHKGELGAAAGGGGRGGRGKDGGAPKAGGADDEARKAQYEKLKALRSQMPAPDDAHTKIWASLRPDQKAALESRVEEFKKSRAEQAGSADAKRLLRKRAEAGGKEKGGDAGALSGQGEGRGAGNLDQLLERMPPERREQLKRRLQGMSEEDRKAWIETMRERRGQRGKGGGEKAPGGG